MLSKTYHLYLQSEHWAQLRKEAINRYGKACQYCQSRKRIEVHHIRYPKPLESATTNDVLPLCRVCHKKVHKLLETAKARRCPREQAEVIIAEHLKDPQALEAVKVARQQALHQIEQEIKARKQSEQHIRKPRWTSRAELHLETLESRQSL